MPALPSGPLHQRSRTDTLRHEPAQARLRPRKSGDGGPASGPARGGRPKARDARSISKSSADGTPHRRARHLVRNTRAANCIGRTTRCMAPHRHSLRHNHNHNPRNPPLRSRAVYRPALRRERPPSKPRATARPPETQRVRGGAQLAEGLPAPCSIDKLSLPCDNSAFHVHIPV